MSSKCNGLDPHLLTYHNCPNKNTEYSTCTVKPVLSSHSKSRPKIVFQTQLSLNEGQKNCSMPQGENSAILSTFIKLPFHAFVIKIFVLSIFEWPLKTDFIVPIFIFFNYNFFKNSVDPEIPKCYFWKTTRRY